MRFSLLLIFSFVLCAGFSLPAQAECSRADIRAKMDADAKNAAMKLQDDINSGWKGPNSFASKYCTAQILSNFDQLGTTLTNGVWALIQNLLNSFLSQVCQAAVAPLQNAASKLCIPFFSLPSFNFNLALNRGFCNGTQLLNVNAIYGTSYGGSNSSYASPLPP